MRSPYTIPSQLRVTADLIVEDTLREEDYAEEASDPSASPPASVVALQGSAVVVVHHGHRSGRRKLCSYDLVDWRLTL